MLKKKGRVEGIQTKFYTDSKVPIRAGMQFGTKNYKIRTIGYDFFRQYYDSAEKDMQVGRQLIKRLIK
jgi:hypothetical protein